MELVRSLRNPLQQLVGPLLPAQTMTLLDAIVAEQNLQCAANGLVLEVLMDHAMFHVGLKADALVHGQMLTVLKVLDLIRPQMDLHMNTVSGVG